IVEVLELEHVVAEILYAPEPALAERGLGRSERRDPTAELRDADAHVDALLANRRARAGRLRDLELPAHEPVLIDHVRVVELLQALARQISERLERLRDDAVGDAVRGGDALELLELFARVVEVLGHRELEALLKRFLAGDDALGLGELRFYRESLGVEAIAQR